MLFGAALPLEPGEQLIWRRRAHAWVVVKAAWPVAALLISPLPYSITDYLLPSLRLAVVFPIYLWLAGIATALLFLKWLLFDLLPWSQRWWVLTDRRIVAQSGVLSIHRRESSLLKIQESDYVSSGLAARLLDLGDVEVQTLSGQGAIILRGVARPREVQAAISAQARELREAMARHQIADAPAEIARQLEAIVAGQAGPHLAPTQVIRPVSPRAARAQQRLNLLPDEIVISATRQHPIVLAAGMLAPGTVAILVAVAAVLSGPVGLPFALMAFAGILAWVAWRIVIYLHHDYVLTTERLIESRNTPFIFQMREVVQLSSVQDVALAIPGLFGRLADIGNIVVDVAGPNERVVLKSVGRPAELQKLIVETMDERLRRQNAQVDQQLIGTLSRWFKEYHKLQEGSRQP